MAFTVLSPGLHTIPVSRGQTGKRAFGIPVGGPADAMSFTLANLILGNSADAVGLEVNFTGPTLKTDSSGSAVLVGAPFTAELIGKQTIQPGMIFSYEPGDVVKITGSAQGARAYLCVPGGFDISHRKPISIHEQLGCLTVKRLGVGLSNNWLVNNEPIRVLHGPQHDWFLQANRFTDTSYVVEPASDRMGLRLNGQLLERKIGELTSEPVSPGAIQVTNNGQPVVLGVDGQTIGGYPKIAHVISADMDRIGQLRPGDRVSFKFVSMSEAETVLKTRLDEINLWKLRLSLRSAG
jgi:5-oxoprolinase (ATP-hydrolysing) subunit C